MSTKTFAAIDVGSYELSMKIYEVSQKKGMRQIDHIRHGIDMGTESYATGRLSRERIEELCNVLREFKKIMDSYGVEDYKAYGTSAIRETKNSAILLDAVEQRTGIHISVLSNSEQRFLDYKSIAFQGETFESLMAKGTAILDVGGGSIQMSIFNQDTLISTQNMKLGVLRLLERMNTLGASLRQYDYLVGELVETQLATYKKLYLKDRSIETLIIVDDHVSRLINRQAGSDNTKNIVDETYIENFMEQIHTFGRAELAKKFGMEEDDIPILYISLLLTQRVMNTTGARLIWAPGVHLSDGIAYEYAEKKGILKSNHNFEDDIVACALQISKRYMGSRKRAQTLEKIALTIFDATMDIHGLSERDRLLLRISTYLHDCGKYISMLNLAECSYNIIRATEIIGISHKERLIVANTVKYNQMIFDYFDEFDSDDHMDKADHKRVAKLTAILRLANGLDRSHKMKFRDVKVTIKDNKMLITVETDEDITLEKGLFGNRSDFFEEVYNLQPVIVQKRSF